MDKRLISCIIALIGSIMLIATLFLPFASATEKYREQLEKFPDTMYAEEIGMTNKDAVNISLFEFGKIYSSTAAAQNAQAVSITCVVMISAFAIFALLSAIFSLLKKPIAIMIFNVLSLATFLLLNGISMTEVYFQVADMTVEWHNILLLWSSYSVCRCYYYVINKN